MRSIKLLLTISIGAVATGCATAPSGPTPLQGTWVVVAAEHEGKPMDVVVGGKLTISGQDFSIHTASGNELQGRFEAASDRSPSEVEFIHANGVRWSGIYEIADGALRLNYVDTSGKEPRPARFATSVETEASLLTLRRSP